MNERAMRPGVIAAHEDRRRIVAAAIRHKTAGWIVVSARHFDALMRDQLNSTGRDFKGCEQGFIDNHGQFWNREDAWDIAECCCQIKRDLPCGGGVLYSEHLY